MKVEQALQNIKEVVKMFRGTLEEHAALQQSIKAIEDELNLNEVVEKVEEKEGK